MKRDQVPDFISTLIGGRPVRWVPAERLVGDYEGRESTLEVFNVDAKDQRPALRVIDAERVVIDAACGGPVVVIFHSVRQSAERHGGFVSSWQPLKRIPLAHVPPEAVAPPEECVDRAEVTGRHRAPKAA